MRELCGKTPVELDFAGLFVLIMFMRARGPDEIKFLVDAVESRRMLWVFCMACGHAERMHPWHLSKRGGGLQKLEDVAKKCRCKKCSRQDALVIPSRMIFEGRG